MQALRTMIPPTVSRIDEIRRDGTVLGFGLFITITCGLFFGLAPATRGARANLLSTLTQSGRGVLGPSSELWRHSLMVAQTGFATTLVVVAALLLQSLVRSTSALGFEPSGVMTARLRVPRRSIRTRPQRSRSTGRCWDRSSRCRLFEPSGLMTSAPFTQGFAAASPLRDRAAARGSSDAPTPAVEQIVSPALFRALGVTLRAVLRGGMTWAGAGIVLGLVGARAASRVIAGLALRHLSRGIRSPSVWPRSRWREWLRSRVWCRRFAQHGSTL